MTRFTAETLDASRLGAPFLVADDYGARLIARLADLQAAWDAKRAQNPKLPPFDTIMLESEPGRVLFEEVVFGDTLLLAAVNDAANALRLATAAGVDLDHIAATYQDTLRLVLQAGDLTANPPRPPVLEPDPEYRERAQLAPEALPLYGITPGGYSYRVRRLFGDRVKGVRALKRPGGHIDLIILGRDGDGTPAPELIGDIQAAFEPEDGSESTDIVTVLPARIVATAIDVTQFILRGPDPEPVKAAGALAIAALAAERHAIGETLHEQAIGAVAKVGPVRRVRVNTPIGDVVGGADGAPWVSAIRVETEIDR